MENTREFKVSKFYSGLFILKLWVRVDEVVKCQSQSVCHKFSFIRWGLVSRLLGSLYVFSIPTLLTLCSRNGDRKEVRENYRENEEKNILMI